MAELGLEWQCLAPRGLSLSHKMPLGNITLYPGRGLLEAHLQPNSPDPLQGLKPPGGDPASALNAWTARPCGWAREPTTRTLPTGRIPCFPALLRVDNLGPVQFMV